MIDIYIIIICVVGFILYNCKIITFNLGWINIVKNLWFILPIITMYLEKDNIGKILNKTKNINISKRRLNESTKKLIAANQKWRCNLCNNMLDASYEIDHIIPLYKGGNNEIYNLQALCRNCHGLKTINDKLNI